MNNKPYKLLLIDEDPIFRLGLRTLLTQFSDFLVIAEADNSVVALRILDETDRSNHTTSIADSTNQESSPTNLSSIARNLVILDPTLNQTDSAALTGLDLCKELKRKYPTISILLLSASQSPALLMNARDVGVEGYCPKGADITEIMTAIRHVVAGQAYGWDRLGQEDVAEVRGLGRARDQRGSGDNPTSPASTPSVSSALPTPFPAPLNSWLQHWRRSGLQQIDAVMVQISQELQTGGSSWLGRQLLIGRQRELRTARWLVMHLSSNTEGLAAGDSSGLNQRASPHLNYDDSARSQSIVAKLVAKAGSVSPTTLQRSDGDDIDYHQFQAMLLDAAVQRLQSGLTNLTNAPLEIDILQSDVKRQLLYLVLRKLETVLDDLRFSQVTPEQLLANRNDILRDLWQAVITDFFGKYRTVQMGTQQCQLVDTLLVESITIQSSILRKIPKVGELLTHLLFLSPLTIDQTTYPAGSPDAMYRTGLLLDNLIIQIANAVVQPLLNRFASVEVIKHNFYDRRLLSTREIERFRNDLSWKYRLEQYVGEPTAIFQSQFALLVLSDRGIKKTTIYANRDQELEALQGIPAIVTLTLELRDAIAPRLNAAVAFVGSGLVYLLTDVVGRSLGLIGRGIIKGIGNALQDMKSKEKPRSNG